MDMLSQIAPLDAPVGVAVIPPGMSAQQRIEQLKADRVYNGRLVSGDKAAEAELLALMRYANKQPAPATTPTPISGTPPQAAPEAPQPLSAPISIPEGYTPAMARARLDELKTDSAWQQRWLAGDKRTTSEFDLLTKLAVGQKPAAPARELTDNEKAIAGLGAPADISGYNLDNIRGPDGGYVQLDDATRTLATTELLPGALALDLSTGDVAMVASNIARPVTWEQCDASLHRLFGADFEARMDDFRQAMAANPKARALLERYPETLGNSPMLIASVVAAFRRRGAR